VYNSVLVSQFVSNLMQCGKKTVAQRLLYDAFAIMEDKIHKPPLEIFSKAIENVKPDLEVKSRRVGGATYQVPVEVRPERKLALAMRWIISYAVARHGK
jgi:small subunit ribosomal protein S7